MAFNIGKTGDDAKVSQKIGSGNDLNSKDLDLSIGETGDRLEAKQEIGDNNKTTSTGIKKYAVISAIAIAALATIRYVAYIHKGDSSLQAPSEIQVPKAEPSPEPEASFEEVLIDSSEIE